METKTRTPYGVFLLILTALLLPLLLIKPGYYLYRELEYKYGRSPQDGRREKKELGIHSVRGGTIVGEHEVIFAGLDEVIEIKHTAYSKAVFAKGAVNAARFLAGKPAGMYTMKEVVE